MDGGAAIMANERGFDRSRSRSSQRSESWASLRAKVAWRWEVVRVYPRRTNSHPRVRLLHHESRKEAPQILLNNDKLGLFFLLGVLHSSQLQGGNF